MDSNNSRLSIIVVLAILLLLNGLLACYWYLDSHKNKKQAEDLEEIVKEKNASIMVNLNKYEQAVHSKEAVEISLKMAKEHYEREIEQLKDQHEIKLKEARSITNIATTTENTGTGQIDTVIITKDSIQQVYPRLSISEQFFEFEAWWYDNGAYSYSYVITDSISLATTTEKKSSLFNTTYQHKVSAISYNDNTRITGLRSITLEEKQSKLQISAIAGYGITSAGLGPFIGIGISKPLIKL